jgi:hypothetical protein
VFRRLKLFSLIDRLKKCLFKRLSVLVSKHHLPYFPPSLSREHDASTREYTDSQGEYWEDIAKHSCLDEMIGW